MYSSNRNELRQTFFRVWEKYQKQMFLDPLESQIIEVILSHPEYHHFLNHPQKFQDADFDDNNPFLHLSLHLALRDQIKTNRPNGIKNVYESLSKKFGNALEAEHQMLPCLQNILWEAQRTNAAPDEQKYLADLKGLIELS